jgi:S1-C subfamily serine protease
MRGYSFVALMLLICFPALSSADADRIFKRDTKAVVVVVACDKEGKAISQGSGFIFRQDGAIVTNYKI